MIKPEQITAARALLKWTQEDLSLKSGIGRTTIKAIETGITDKPRNSTLEPIINAFEECHVEFIEGGVRTRKDLVRTIEGADFFEKLLDDIYYSCKEENIPEVLFAFADNSKSSKTTIEKQKLIRKMGVKFRFLVRENDTYLNYPVKEYRYVPEQYFHPRVQIIYGDKFAVMSANNSQATVFHDKDLAFVQKSLFDQLWSFYKKPEISTAEVIYE